LLALTQTGMLVRAADDWQFDVVHLKKGKRAIEGLLVEEKADEVRFKCISRKPGAATVVLSTTFARDEIDRLERLPAKDRALLEERLAALAQERTSLAARLKALEAGGKTPSPLEAIDLKPVPWGKDGKDKALGYDSTYFQLACNATDRIAVQEAAVRLEQIFAAYARLLPPAPKSGRPTTILLPQSFADYQLLLKDQGRNLLNPAFYDATRNQVVCVYELPRLSENLRTAYQKNRQQLERLKEQEAQLDKLFKGNIPARYRDPIEDSRKQIE
jgi:hypothetical protein